MPAKTPRIEYPFYVLRLWQGMTAGVLLRILARHRFAVSPRRLAVVVLGLVYAILNSAGSVVQTIIFARRIRACTLDQAPLFIIGHWRTGTTHLHELLTLDERFTAPTMLECLAPKESLAFGWLLRLFGFLMPAHRPMDAMPVGWDRPQEDEFAILALGLGSPYEAIMFPKSRRADHPFLNLAGLRPDEMKAWQAGLLGFLQQVKFRHSREGGPHGKSVRIVLKSPTHTARLRILREMFPAAQFIHLVREPHAVFSSTVKLWRALYDTQGCQEPDREPDDGALSPGVPSLEQYVLDSMDQLYRDFFVEVAKIPARDFCQVRYEDLVREPLAEMSRIYRHLGLGSFEEVEPKLKAAIHAVADYRRNEHRLPDETAAEIDRRWRWYIERFGYGARSS
jgi:omega-hydroxy-beta-dihydromenaquinone-9 sulfotransferase